MDFLANLGRDDNVVTLYRRLALPILVVVLNIASKRRFAAGADSSYNRGTMPSPLFLLHHHRRKMARTKC